MSIHVVNDPERASREAWRAAFDEQLTRTAITSVLRYATKRGKLLTRVGVLSKRCGPTELLNEAVLSTLSGEATWDPAAVPLKKHLIWVVKWKTRNTERHRANYPQASLSDSRDDTSSDGRRLENEATLTHLPPPAPAPAALRATAERVMVELSPLAQGDTDVLRILGAIETGADNGQLMKVSGLRPAKFRNARRRLARITERLSDETRAAVSAVLS